MERKTDEEIHRFGVILKIPKETFLKAQKRTVWFLSRLIVKSQTGNCTKRNRRNKRRLKISRKGKEKVPHEEIRRFGIILEDKETFLKDAINSSLLKVIQFHFMRPKCIKASLRLPITLHQRQPDESQVTSFGPS
ncbi:hypothetical protein CDAR_80661 [Caerostris darwini]|uniref:Ribosomal protein S10 n=1 Tax=Caerostris darwini TaxID=1538125 RepID=A0AAV4Q6Q7_9ARAC|nr:hypothetical protein CDAR_80661 [Caerostris darwini]